MQTEKSTVYVNRKTGEDENGFNRSSTDVVGLELIFVD